MWVYIIQGLGLGLAAAAQPGPFQAYLISQSLRLGWRKALPAALAPLLSDGPIITLTLLILSRIPPLLQQGLHFAGGFFILFLAARMGQSLRKGAADEGTHSGTQVQSVWNAALMNLLNPNPYIYWSLVTGPILIAAWRSSSLYGLGFLVAFYTSMLTGLAAVIVFFGVSRNLGPKVNQVLLIISTVVLGCFGILQLWLGLRSLIAV